MSFENETVSVDFNIVKAIVRIVFNETAKSLNGLSSLSKVISADYVFQQVKELKKCSDITFIQCLNIIKKEYPKVYGKIQLPPYWNGRSEIYFPECYPAEGKMQFKVLRALNAKKVFPDIEHDHIWLPNEIVWLPEDNQNVFTAIDDGYLTPI